MKPNDSAGSIDEKSEEVKIPSADRPCAILFCTDLMFSVELQNMARKAGCRVVFMRPEAHMPDGEILIVDLSARGDWEKAIHAAQVANIPVIAFGPHMNSESRARARVAGAQRVLANSNLSRDLPSILAGLKMGVHEAGGSQNIDVLGGEGEQD